MVRERNKKVQAIIFAFAMLLTLVSGLFLYTRSWENSLFIDPLYQLDPQEKIVALTFDDGPNAKRTPPLLDLLAKHEVKASFFMLGLQIEREPEIAKRVFEAGHLIGNHTYDHSQMIFKSPSFMRAQIERTDSLIQAFGAAKPTYFRPPYSSKYVILPWVLKQMGKTLVTGSYDPPSEYRSPYPAQQVADEVLANVQNGSIIYLHDGKSSDVEAFLQSVELIIVGLKAKGYRLVRIDE
ncbi:MAG: polysaccharide deacetylase family protein [Bacteroidota bacterium]